MYELHKGSIFESKCDLLIIPSDNDGSVMGSVRADIQTHNLPYIWQEIPLGSVLFRETTGEFNNALIVGYAAAVDAFAVPIHSSVGIIERIMLSILRYAREHSIRKINIPLLGTGAGELSYQESFQTIIKHFKDERNISLNVYAYKDEVYSDLLGIESPPKSKILENPRVFVSYTGYDSENERWVRSLVDKLRSNGVDARVDMYHLKPGVDLPQWMTNEIILAEKVLLICDKYYAEKADSRKGGVGWETMIIHGDMLFQNQNKAKYIAIVREKDIDQGLPIYMRSKYALHWAEHEPKEDEFKELIMHIFDCNVADRVGDIPQYVIDNLSN